MYKYIYILLLRVRIVRLAGRTFSYPQPCGSYLQSIFLGSDIVCSSWYFAGLPKIPKLKLPSVPGLPSVGSRFGGSQQKLESNFEPCEGINVKVKAITVSNTTVTVTIII